MKHGVQNVLLYSELNYSIDQFQNDCLRSVHLILQTLHNNHEKNIAFEKKEAILIDGRLKWKKE